MLRVACADLLGKLDVEQVCAALSAVWVAVLQATLLASALRALGGATPPARLAVIGMGRLGGGGAGLRQRRRRAVRLRAASTGATDHEAVRYATTVAETVRRRLGSAEPGPGAGRRRRPAAGGPVRPAGAHPGVLPGVLRALVGGLGGAGAAAGPPVAGDADLGRRFLEMVDPIRYPADGLSAGDGHRDPPDQGPGRRRAAAPRAPTASTHTKLGHGGLADVEWTVQLLQLQHAGDVPELRTTSTLDGLREAARGGPAHRRGRRRSWPRAGRWPPARATR